MDDELRYNPTKFSSRHAAGAAAVTEKTTSLPDLSAAYKAADTVIGEEKSLAVIMGKEGFRLGSIAYITFQYVHIGTGEFGFIANGQWFTYPFFDFEPKLLTVHGRNLLGIFDDIRQHKISWIRQADRDFGEVDEPIITRAAVTDWKRPAKEQAKALEEAMEEEAA